MKQNILIGINLIFGLAICYLIYQHFHKQNNIVYIESPKIVAEYKGMVVVNKEIELKTKQYQARIDTLENEMQSLMKKYEKEREGLSVKERMLSEELFRNKQQQYQQYQQAMEQRQGEENSKLQQKVLAQINTFIKDYAKKQHYQFVIGASYNGNLLYAEEHYNITDEVLAALNKEYVTAPK